MTPFIFKKIGKKFNLVESKVSCREQEGDAGHSEAKVEFFRDLAGSRFR